MKSLIKFFCFALIAQIILFSCKTTDTVKPSNNIIIDFKGEKVSISANFPQNLFNQSQEDFSRYYAQLSGAANARVGENKTLLTYDDLVSILLPESKKYPKLSYEEKISDEDLKRIFKDFPSVTTYEQAQEKLEIIFEYYETLMKYEVVPKVIAFEKSKQAKSARITSDASGLLSDYERDFLNSHPIKGLYYGIAGNTAKNETISRFGTSRDKKRENSFQHSVWNALAIRYIIIETPTSESNAVSFVREGTSAHEKMPDGAQIKDDNAAMDLHNNMSARKWMKDETKWGYGPFRKMPSDNKIFDTMQERANSANKNSLNDILNLHGGMNDDSWNRLYNDDTGSYGHLVYIED